MNTQVCHEQIRMHLFTCMCYLHNIVLKQNRITEIASENNLPLIALVQSVSNTSGGSVYKDSTEKFLRPVYSSPNNFVSFTRVARYFEILLGDLAMASLALQQSSVHRLQGEPIIQAYLTTRFSFKTKLRCSWEGHL
jgi:hypothetical protein